MMGIAVGEIGISLADFDALTPPEFEIIYRHYLKVCEDKYKNAWERARFISLYALLPHSRKALKPKDICVFEWEKPQSAGTEEATVEETKEHFKVLVEKWKGAS